jgi:protein-S-isoprenylcysteine O-methyltransferase Ste14
VADLARRIARWRVPLGFGFGVVAVWLSQPTRLSLLVGGLIAACGESVRIWAAGHLEKGREVTSSGPYRLTRHPLYLGSSILGVGLAIGSHSAIVTIIVAAYLAVTLTAAIRSEEAHLTEKFGDAYPAYRGGAATPSAARGFSLARAMRNREYRALVGFLVALALLAWKAGLF